MAQHVRLEVDPPLSTHAERLLDELGGRSEGPRRIWRGQPGPRCPWRHDRGRLVLDPSGPEDPVAWLRFLLREVLAPSSQGALARTAALGLTDRHLVRGWLTVADEDGMPRHVEVRGRRVEVMGRPRARGGALPDPVSQGPAS